MRHLRACVALSALIFAVQVHAQTRTYAGSVQTNWQTVGKHGHNQPPCAGPRITKVDVGWIEESPNCNPVDFANGNLDNTIGFRGGVERDFLSLGPLTLVGGLEGAVSYTEYNLTQTDFIFASGTAMAGADLRLGAIRIGARAGAGPFATTDGAEYGLLHTHGLHLTLPLRPGAALRIARQEMQVFGGETSIDVYGAGPPTAAPSELVLRRAPRAVETSLLVVTSPESLGATAWDFSASTGTTLPGGPIGSSRMLRSSAFSQVAAYRDLPWRRTKARVTWTSSAHESSLPSTFLGFDDNYRSKTIQGLGLGVTRSSGRLFDHFSLRYGGGLEVADWSDEHQLLTRDEKPLAAGVELAFTADAAVRWHFAPNLALEASFEKAYWRNIDLGESRVAFGIVIAH
jgi:hypothetical protein